MTLVKLSWDSFTTVIEAALGADLVAYQEGKELVEKGFLTSSCCPAFVSYIHKNFPKLVPNISHNLSPMAMIAEMVKRAHPDSKIVFVGPCVAKKGEIKQERVRELVDVTITFEELQALFDAYDVDLPSMEDDVLNNASYFGRIFARSGGLKDAVEETLKELEIKPEQFQLKAISCSGLEGHRFYVAITNALIAIFAVGLLELDDTHVSHLLRRSPGE